MKIYYSRKLYLLFKHFLDKTELNFNFKLIFTYFRLYRVFCIRISVNRHDNAVKWL